MTRKTRPLATFSGEGKRAIAQAPGGPPAKQEQPGGKASPAPTFESRIVAEELKSRRVVRLREDWRPNWRDPNPYTFGGTRSPADWTWEFMRRTEAYRNAWILSTAALDQGNTNLADQIALAWRVTRHLPAPNDDRGVEFSELEIGAIPPPALGQQGGRFRGPWRPKRPWEFAVILDLAASMEKQIALVERRFRQYVDEAKERKLELQLQPEAPGVLPWIVPALREADAAAPPWPPHGGKRPRQSELPTYLRIVDALHTEFVGRKPTSKSVVAELASVMGNGTEADRTRITKSVQAALTYANGRYWDILAFLPWNKWQSAISSCGFA